MIDQLGGHLVVSQGQARHFPLDFIEIPFLTLHVSHISTAT